MSDFSLLTQDEKKKHDEVIHALGTHFWVKLPKISTGAHWSRRICRICLRVQWYRGLDARWSNEWIEEHDEGYIRDALDCLANGRWEGI